MAGHGVLVVGAFGRMGRCVRSALAGQTELELRAALEVAGHPEIGSLLPEGIVVGDDSKAALAGCSVVIDFSVPAATLSHLREAAAGGVAYVTGTTGFDAAEIDEIRELAARVPVVHAPNFSVSVNVLAWLVREAARVLGTGYDAELLELHHSAKRDAPSGTALMLAEAVAAGRGQRLADHLVLTREGQTGPRPGAAIGVQTLRGGDNPGEHTVLFVGAGERIELIHRASSRDHFARGALRAAAWLVGREPGLYPLEQVLGLD